nr:S-adenosylmethionine:tRNA ribosyltransferase-isomerase [Rhodothermaceae bacterium]
MQLSEFEFELPEALIAQSPLERRDASKMLVLDRSATVWVDRQFSQLPSYLESGDVLVVNNTRVFPARLIGHRIPSGGKAELFLVKQVGTNSWEALV